MSNSTNSNHEDIRFKLNEKQTEIFDDTVYDFLRQRIANNRAQLKKEEQRLISTLSKKERIINFLTSKAQLDDQDYVAIHQRLALNQRMPLMTLEFVKTHILHCYIEKPIKQITGEEALELCYRHNCNKERLQQLLAANKTGRYYDWQTVASAIFKDNQDDQARFLSATKSNILSILNGHAPRQKTHDQQPTRKQQPTREQQLAMAEIFNSSDAHTQPRHAETNGQEIEQLYRALFPNITANDHNNSPPTDNQQDQENYNTDRSRLK